MIRVLELFGEPISHGGQESYVMTQLSNMNRDGFHFDLATPYFCDNEEYRAQMEAWGGQVFALDLPFRPGKSREYLTAPVREFLSDKSYDIIHIHSGSSSIFAIFAKLAKQSASPCVIAHSHVTAPKQSIKSKLVRLVSGLRMRPYVDCYCACSRAAAFSKFLPSKAEKATILINGIDVKAFEFSDKDRVELRTKAGLVENTFLLGNVGRLSEQKNQVFLLEVLSEEKKINPNTVLWLVGDGSCRDELEKKAAELGVLDSVKFWGARSDANKLLSAMDCFVFPSKFEGFGIAALEAEANGLPCLLSVAIPDDVVVKGCNTKKMSLSDGPAAWAKRIEKLSERNTNAAQLLMRQGFDAKSSANQMRDMYLNVNSNLNLWR